MAHRTTIARLAAERKPIVWLASYPKSGNTWLRILLANLLSSSQRPFPLHAVPFGFAVDDFRFGELTGVSAADCTADEVERLIPACLRAHAAESAAGAARGLRKAHAAWVANRAGQPLFPADVSAGAVYIVRNPLDVAVSWAFHAEGGSVAKSVALLNNVDAAIGGKDRMQYRTRLLDWSGHVRSWRAAPFPVLTVRYEDLLADAVHELRRVARFLGCAGVTEAQLRQAVAWSEFKSLRRREERHGYRGTPTTNPGLFFREGRAGGWREALSATEVRTIVRRHWATMAAFGYDPASALDSVDGAQGGAPAGGSAASEGPV